MLVHCDPCSVLLQLAVAREDPLPVVTPLAKHPHLMIAELSQIGVPLHPAHVDGHVLQVSSFEHTGAGSYAYSTYPLNDWYA